MSASRTAETRWPTCRQTKIRKRKDETQPELRTDIRGSRRIFAKPRRALRRARTQTRTRQPRDGETSRKAMRRTRRQLYETPRQPLPPHLCHKRSGRAVRRSLRGGTRIPHGGRNDIRRADNGAHSIKERRENHTAEKRTPIGDQRTRRKRSDTHLRQPRHRQEAGHRSRNEDIAG